jgi:hypothetical protein
MEDRTMSGVDLTAAEIELLIKAMDKLSWSYSHVGMAERNPKRVALAELRAKIVASGASQGDMRPMWTFEGDELRNLLEDFAQGDEYRWGPIRTVRFAVDEGDLKWKINEDMWAAGKAADEEGQRS